MPQVLQYADKACCCMAGTVQLPRKPVRYFRRLSDGWRSWRTIWQFAQVLATSASRHLEGTLRRNWWGFAGRKSADASLHEKAGPELLAACRAQASYLGFGEASYVLHTVVPGHPSSRDPRPMPLDRAADYASDDAEAERLLRQSFAGILAKSWDSHGIVIAFVCCKECNSFAEQFFAANCHRFSDLEGPDVAKTEQKAEWFDVFKRFEAEAELTMQNALFLWGLVQAKTFQEEFDAKLAEDKPRLRKRQDSLRPDTPMGNLETQQKLSELDQRLAALEDCLPAERNSLLVERRKLVGREVHATTRSGPGLSTQRYFTVMSEGQQCAYVSHAETVSEWPPERRVYGGSHKGLVAKTVQLNAKSLCCPAIGCGIRGFPAPLAARAGLHHLVPEAKCAVAQAVPYVEVRFWDTNVLNAWTAEAFERDLVKNELWQGHTLAEWTQKKKEAENLRCSVS
eukprot:s240_g42.t2